MKKTIKVLFIIFLFASPADSQTIEIGNEADYVKRLIEWRTRDHNRSDSYGNRASSYVTWDAEYQNGQIANVIQCYQNQYLLDFRLIANFCKHYVMEREKLDRIVTQYENISKEKLEELYLNIYSDRKIENYYFDEDYKHFSQIYLANNGYASVEYNQTKTSNLPSGIKLQVENKLKEIEDAERKKKIAEEERKQKIREIKSKTYDLEEHNKQLYKKVFAEQKQRIKEYFETKSGYRNANKFPSFYDLELSDKKSKQFNNVYTVKYKLEDHSREGVDHGFYIEAGSRDIKRTYEAVLVSGDDKECELIKTALISIPTIKIEGVEAMTKANFENIKVDFTRGITEIKIKKGEIAFTKDAPEINIQNIIKSELWNCKKGKYTVKYEIGEIMGEEIKTIEIEN